ncbi:hypothetical protein [Cloacibacterium sp. TD35]|uniref:hypothetical protein n=1 Tax=Cloacibacterium sp. TD35 TaxID=2976818 RepID=UPI00237DFFE0|nr:hypothetical protein [Cloacibacterium sp. TD35]WDT67296.1 hypothetical protein N7277_08110 [Cloacibacterium sp. TD35]
MKKINLLKTAFLFLLLLIVSSCRTDNNFTQDKRVAEESIAKQISYQSFLSSVKNQNNIVLSTRIKSDKNSKSKNDILENFSIDESKILMVKMKNETTYSMRLVPSIDNDPKNIYNLYVKKDSLGNISQTIIKYSPTIASIKNNYKNLNGLAQVIYNDTKPQNKKNRIAGDGCWTAYVEVACEYGYVHYQNGPGEWCDGSGSYHFEVTLCGAGGESGGESPIEITTDNIAGSGSSVFIPSSTRSKLLACEEQDSDEFIYALYSANQNWADQNISFFNNIVNNLCFDSSLQNKQLINWQVNFFSNNSLAAEYFKNNPQDMYILSFDDFDVSNSEDVELANSAALAALDLLRNNQLNILNLLDTSWSNMDDLKLKMKEKFKKGVPTAVKFGKYVYSTLKKVTDKYPETLVYANKGIDKIRAEIHNEGLINYDVHTMTWKDVIGSWLFELGNYPVNSTTNLPTLGFAGADYTISGNPYDVNMRHLTTHKTLSNGNPDENSIMFLRNKVVNQIKQNIFAMVNGEWHFGTDATIDTITKLDGMQFCLGSYQTDVYIRALGNKQYELTFIVKNKTGWQSGTRRLNDYNGNSTDDSIIPDKPRGDGLHLGGTIGETFGWKEIITVN